MNATDAYIAILRNRLVELRTERADGDPNAPLRIECVLIRIRYARRGRTAELNRYGSPIHAPRIAPGAAP